MPIKPAKTTALPQSICFRVTRYCNAHCGFCLAPPEGSHPDVKILISRLDWLLRHGVNTLHFCGGEPTIHPGLPQIIDHVHKHGGKTKLTTNGIKLPEPLLPLLRQTKAQVKVSLHGNQAHHDAIVGRAAFAQTTQNIQRLVAAGVHVSVQTTIVAGASDAIGWVTDFCLANKVRRLSLMPFIPRGNGLASRQDYELSPTQRRALREQVAKCRHNLVGRLDLRWLDFTARPIHVVEADGRVILESATVAHDIELFKIPVPT